MPTLNKLEYLDETKQQIRTALNQFGTGITTEDTFRSYVSKINGMYDNWSKVTDEGTNISLTPTKKGKMITEIKGNTYQYSTTGKNLFDKNGTQALINAASLTILDTGVRAIATSSGSYCYRGIKIPNIDNLLGKSLILSATIQVSASNNGRVCFVYFDSSNVIVGNPFSNLRETGTVAVTIPSTLPTNAVGVAILFYANENGTTNTNDYVDYTNVQLELGSTPTDYEPYTGGQPSPSPDFPQEIKVVTGEQNITITGKNLFKPFNYNRTNNGIDFTYSEDGYITCNGTSTGNALSINSSSSTPYQITLQAGVYTISGEKTDIRLEVVNASGTALCNTDSSRTFTLSETTNVFIRANIPSGKTFNNVEVYPMLEKGDQATSYEPYISRTFPINLGNIELCKIGDYQDYIKRSTGKNLFDKTKALNGKRISSTTGEVNNVSDCSCSDYINVTGLSKIILSGATITYANNGAFYDNNKDYISGFNSTSIKNGVSVPTNAQYIRFSTLTNDLDTTQLEEGSQATSYEPYGHQFYLHKDIGDVVLDGTESWVYQSEYLRFYNPLSNNALQSERAKSKSNYYIYGNTETTNNTFFISSSNILLIRNENITTLNDFKQWLSTHNTKVQYVLQTPTTEVITNTELINQLELLYNASSCDTITNISVEGDLPANIKAYALKKGGN